VHAHPNPDGVSVRPRLGRQPPLSGHGRSRRGGRRGEHREDRVALGAHDAPAAAVLASIEDLEVAGLEP
jgi:hypothetical protein